MTDLGLILSVLGIEVGPSGGPVLSVGEGTDARILRADGEDRSCRYGAEHVQSRQVP